MQLIRREFVPGDKVESKRGYGVVIPPVESRPSGPAVLVKWNDGVVQWTHPKSLKHHNVTQGASGNATKTT